MRPKNMLFIMSDEHNRAVLGCSGHPMIRTPNLDRPATRRIRIGQSSDLHPSANAYPS